MNIESSLFMCYSLDTGLLLTQAMSGSSEIDGKLICGVLYYFTGNEKDGDEFHRTACRIFPRAVKGRGVILTFRYRLFESHCAMDESGKVR